MPPKSIASSDELLRKNLALGKAVSIFSPKTLDSKVDALNGFSLIVTKHPDALLMIIKASIISFLKQKGLIAFISSVRQYLCFVSIFIYKMSDSSNSQRVSNFNKVNFILVLYVEM